MSVRGFFTLASLVTLDWLEDLSELVESRRPDNPFLMNVVYFFLFIFTSLYFVFLAVCTLVGLVSKSFFYLWRKLRGVL
jgi:hypothetical protein